MDVETENRTEYPTYFAADIAYHYNKLATRGFAKAIDVWGADHHGHVARMKGAMDAIGLNGEDLDVVLMQMVNLMRDGHSLSSCLVDVADALLGVAVSGRRM